MLEKIPEAVGRALRSQRAGMDETAFSTVHPRLPIGATTIEVHSPAFVDNEPIPDKYTADGAGVSPPIEWEGIPPQAASVVVMVEDPDAPAPHPLVHAIVVDLPPRDGGLPEGSLRGSDYAGTGLNTGRNSYLQASWLPPDPPSGHGVHRYAFQVFALSAGPIFPETPGREVVLEALRERAIAAGCLIGTYQRA